MKRQVRVYLDDIIESVERIGEYVSGLTKEEFYENELVQDSVVRRLEIIGEAVKNMPAELKKKYSEINWRRLSGARDIYAHAYFKVNQRLVWKTITDELPDLKEQIMKVRNDLKDEA